MSMHTKTDSEVTSLAPSSPNRAVYYVQSPSRDSSHDGEKTTNSFHSTPILSPMGSPGRQSRDSSSTRYSGPAGSQKSTTSSNHNKRNNSRSNYKSRHMNNHRSNKGDHNNKQWNHDDFDAIEEEDQGLIEEEGLRKDGRRRWYVLGFIIGFFVLFSFFALILWGASRNQKPVVIMKSILFERFFIQAGSDSSGVATEMVSMNSTVKFTFRNKGTFFGVHVTSTPLDLSFSQLTFATGIMKNFYQSRRSQRTVTVMLIGNNIPLYGGGSDLRSKEGKPAAPVPLNLNFVVRARAYVLGKLVKPKFYRNIQCSVVLDPAKMNVALSLKKCTYL